MGGLDLAKTYLGIELGSTRIKAVLTGEGFAPVASGGHDWENRLENGVWTYALEDVWVGLQGCIKALGEDLLQKHGQKLEAVGGIGISAMMHGYLAFDKGMGQLAEFRTWRNTSTGAAAALLTGKFGVNIPQRWSIAHLYQAMLNGEGHVKDIAFLTTLAGYVHYRLTGRRVLGVGDASGMFPIDGAANAYDPRMVAQFEGLAKEKGFDLKLNDILPKALNAGGDAGTLTGEGAKLLDPTGTLKPGCPLCPPEGDAGAGMVATNAVKEHTGNVSAGTSIFAMIVLEKGLSKLYTEIDMVTTPTGRPVAMVHCNNCTSDLDAWAKLFLEALALMGAKPGKAALYDALYAEALKAEADCGGLLSYNYLSGEHTTGFEEGRPLLARTPDSRLTLANLMRTLVFSSMATLKLGMDILTDKEKVKLEKLLGHGGLFKTEGVGQRLMAAALGVPVAVMGSAGEGGAWGISLLAAYAAHYGHMPLEAFLAEKVFAGAKGSTAAPEKPLQESFAAYIERYSAGLPIERAAVENLR
jgi:sugar (pentulose or hexulose) kinase